MAMEYFELVSALFVTAGFLLAMSRTLQTWFTVDLILSVLGGLSYLFAPQIVLSYETTGDFTGVHLLVARMFGIAFLAGAVKLYLNSRSHDNYAQAMLLATRFVASAIVLLVVVHAFYGDTIAGKVEKAPPKPKEGEKPPPKSSKGVELNEEMKLLIILFTAGPVLGNGIWFLRSRHYGGHTSLDSMLNMHLRVDFFITLMVAIIWMAFTPTLLGFKVGLTSPDKAHLLYGQAVGAMLIGDAILSAVAPGFLFEEDKRNILLGRVMMMVAYGVLVGVYCIFIAGSLEDCKNLIFALVFDAAWAVNGYLGYKIAPHETTNYRSPPRKMRHKSDEDDE